MIPVVLFAGPRVATRLIGGDVYSITNESMKPTLLVGDTVLATPLPSGEVPKRGTVAVFQHPVSNVDFIFRFVGLPGEQVQIIDGRVHIDGLVLAQTPIADFVEMRGIVDRSSAACRNVSSEQGMCAIERARETMPDGQSYEVLNLGDFPADNTGVIAVPEGHVLVLGDNRDNALDSRFEQTGLVPVANLKDRVLMVHTSINGLSPRWPRFFKRIE